MNIFATHHDPLQATSALDDARTLKLALESAQLLSTALHLHEPTYAIARHLYKPTHPHHPLTLWVARSRGNYLWTMTHFIGLCAQYERTYGKLHASLRLLQSFAQGAELVPKGPRSPFVNCAQNLSLGLSYYNIEDPIEAYRDYLMHRYALAAAPLRFYGRANALPEWMLDHPRFEHLHFNFVAPPSVASHVTRYAPQLTSVSRALSLAARLA